jgi:hypothetical protein
MEAVFSSEALVPIQKCSNQKETQYEPDAFIRGAAYSDPLPYIRDSSF